LLTPVSRSEQLPTLIAFAHHAEQVGPLIKCAHAAGIKAVPRTGGHHFLAYSALSDTLVIDISHIDTVHVADDKATAVVGAGIRLGALYTALGLHDRTWPGGICPTVGLSGFLSAGGFNMQMRALGLGVDNVLAAKVVTASGCLVTASPAENPDLFWAVRGGGGGLYGVVVEWTLRLHDFPRHAMLLMRWQEPDSRVDVASRFFAWAPKADPRLMSQVNVHKNRTEVLGWCYGCPVEDLRALADQSGLAQIGQPEVHISGGCSTNNARLIGFLVDECVPDAQIAEMAPLAMNYVQQPFNPVANFTQYRYDQSTQDPDSPDAMPWARFVRLSKSFFVEKEDDIARDVVQHLVDRLSELPDEAAGWGEWHAWNVTVSGDAEAAFPWRDHAYAHLEFILQDSADEAKHKNLVDWSDRVEAYLRPKLGPASYSGYMDGRLSVSPRDSYHGASYERLVAVKRQYDPHNFFTNPQGLNEHWEV
jgi:FAD/FMN-containing dehydrogenase